MKTQLLITFDEELSLSELEGFTKELNDLISKSLIKSAITDTEFKLLEVSR